MIEVKSTKGIEKNMHSEIENLVRKAYEEGREHGHADGALHANTCSWEKGVTDAWETIINMLELFLTDFEIPKDDERTVKSIISVLKADDAVSHTRDYVEVRNLAEEEDELEVGDVVLDPADNECVITNMETHIHVIYPKNGKTKKWDKDTKFKPTGKHIIGVGKVEL